MECFNNKIPKSCFLTKPFVLVRCDFLYETKQYDRLFYVKNKYTKKHNVFINFDPIFKKHYLL